MSRVIRFLMVLLVLAGSGSMGLSQTLPIYSYSVPQGGYDGNGNLVSYTDSVTGNWSAQYDSADRLTSVVSNAGPYGGVTLQWGYDSFGNRLSQSWTVAAGSSPSGYLPTSSWATYNARNQVVTSGPNPGGQYDASGNMVSDGQRSLLYDAEGRVCAEYTPGVGSVVQYVYDAEGVRVAKLLSSTLVCPDYTGGAVGSAGTVEATYIVGQGGEQLTEFDGAGHWKHTNVYAGGKLLATYDGAGLHFPVMDALGTVRMQVNAIGAAEESTTSLPYGDGMTTTALVPGAQDATEHHFTGKERDVESGLDNFGARYYGSTMGRFMSPDWTETPDPTPYADLKNPQSLNLYSYGLNNPLRAADPDGHRPVTRCSPDTTTDNHDGTYSVNPGKCTTMDDGSIDPSSDGFGLILGWGAGKLLGPVLGGGARMLGAAIDSIGEALGFSSDAITITEDGMEHVLERHSTDGTKNAGKSLFKGSKNEIKSLIKKAGSTPPTTQANGNLARVVDAGRTIGVDRATGAPTSTYTVITKASGDLVTAFPGKP